MLYGTKSVPQGAMTQVRCAADPALKGRLGGNFFSDCADTQDMQADAPGEDALQDGANDEGFYPDGDEDDKSKVSRWQIGAGSLSVLEQVYQVEPFPGEPAQPRARRR